MNRYLKKVCAIVLSVSLVLTAMPVIQTVSAAQVDTASISTPATEVKEAYILNEIEQRREESVKHFRMSDGSIMAVQYSQPVHYVSSENKLEEIDNTLKLTADGNAYVNTANDFKAYFPKNKDGNFALEYNGYNISWKTLSSSASRVEISNATESAVLKSTKSAAEKQEITVSEVLEEKQNKLYSKAEYSSFLSKEAVTYELNGKEIKESIILSSKPNNAVYSYEFNSNGLTAVLNGDNSVTFYTAEKEAVYKIATPYMFDSAENISTDIAVTLTQKNDKYIYTITPNNEWLLSEEREYPVTIDPTIIPAYKSTNIKDTTAVFGTQSGMNTSYLNAYYMRIGEKSELGNHEVAGAIYADIPSNIPATARIINASVNVAFYDIQGPSRDSGIILSAYQIKEDWNTKSISEDIILYYGNDYLNKISTEALDYLKVEYSTNFITPIKSAENNYSVVTKYHAFDITRAAQNWMHNNNNYGIMLRMDTEDVSAQNYLMLYASDHDQSDPYFVFVYRDTTGLEDYWSYHSASAGNAGTGYVNDFNGNLTFISGIDGESTEKYGVQLNLVYNSNNTDSTQFFGNGWNLNVMQKVGSEAITQANETVTYYYYIDSDGTKHYFYDDDGTYKDEDGLGLVYTAVGTSSDIVRYEIKTKDDTTLGFGNDGWLRQIIDANGNKINFNYENGRINNITDKENQEIFSFVYSSSKITQIKNERSGKVVNLTYNNGNLISVETASGGLSLKNEYAYDGNLLISATDDTGYRINYGYTHYTVTLSNNSASFYRVTEVTESALEGENRVNGQTLKIEYDSATRTFFEDGGTDGNINTEEDNNKSTYLFDYYGQPVSVYDSKGRASVFEYNQTEETKHQLSAAANGDKSNLNLLTDPSFEEENSWSVNGEGIITRYLGSYQGNYCLVISNLYADDYIEFYQQVDNLNVGIYTFSIYINSRCESTSLTLFANETNDESLRQSATYQLYEIGGWQRYQLTFEKTSSGSVTVGASFSKDCELLFADCAKLEKGELATSFNIIENPTFNSGSRGDIWDMWRFENHLSETSVLGYNEESVSALRVLPAFKEDLVDSYVPVPAPFVRQVINTTGNEGDIYRLSGWAKAAAMPKDTSHFYVEIEVLYAEGGYKEYTLNFNKDIPDWQYGSIIISTDDNDPTTQKTYESIIVTIYYSNQLNNGYFTDIELVKDNATSYTYDEEGNVVSVKDIASGNSFEYDGNSRLTAYADSTGNGFKYAYDNNNNLISAIASGGIEQGYSYNSYGQATGTAATYNKVYPEIEDGGVYYIRNKATGKYIDVSGDNDADNTNLQQYDFIGSPEYNLQKYTFNKTEDGYYTITANLSATGRKFTVKDGNNADGTNIVIKTADSSDSQKFKLEYAGNGGYRITAKVADGEKALSNYSGDTGNWSHIKLQTIDEDNNNQVFFLEDALLVDTLPVVENGKIYSIRNVNTGNYLTNSNQTALSQGRNGDTEQYFLLEKSGNTEYYYIKVVNATNKVLQISGSNLSFAEKTQSDAQLFSLELVTSYPTSYSNACRFYKIVPKSAQGYSLTCTSSSVTTTADYNTSVLWAFEETLVTSSSAVYSANGEKLQSVEDARGTTTTYTYDSKDRLVTGVQVGNQSTTTAYDALDRVSSVSSGDSSVAYNYSGSRLSSINAGGNVYNFTYDGFGNTLSTKIGNRTLATYTYLPYNKGMSRMTYGNGAYIDYTYNSDGNTTEKKYNGTTAVSYKYDNQGRVIQINDHLSGKVTEYVYDFIGRIVSVNTSDSSVLAYGYDNENRVSTQTSSAGGVTVTSQYTYDDDGKLTKFDDDITGFDGIEYTYDELQRVTNKNVSDKFNITYSYLKGKNNQETALVETMTVGNDTYRDTYRYEYDEYGNIVSYTDYMGEKTYFYDSLNRLVGETNNNYITYTYDDRGNILSVHNYMENRFVKTFVYGNSEWKDLLTNYNGTNISYDTIGNPLNWRNNMSFTWANGRRLIGVTNGTNNYSYTYDADGLRTSKTVNGVTTTYTYAEGLLLALETSDGKKMRFLYDGASSPYAMLFNGTMYYYEYNLQGDVVGILDSSKTRVAGYEYNAWGEIISIFGSDYSLFGALNPFRYRGYVYDEETGFYYLNTRYYDPEMCRFINADGQISGIGNDICGYNMFAYCFNNPVNMTDENGNWPKWGKIKEKIKNAANWAEKNVLKPAANFIVNAFEIEGGTSYGFSGEMSYYGWSVGTSLKTDMGHFVINENGFESNYMQSEASITIDFYNYEVGPKFVEIINHDGTVEPSFNLVTPKETIPLLGFDFAFFYGFNLSINLDYKYVQETVVKLFE